MASRLGDHLHAARRRHFVGREIEKQRFQTALAAPEPPFYVLHIYGPGGVGKTSLLHEFEELARQTSAYPVYLDARHIDASSDAFLTALSGALGVAPPAGIFDFLASCANKTVLLIDTYEALTALDAWLYEQFLPQLPTNVLIVMAGRNPPAPAWRSDPGWQNLISVLPLRNLTPEESHAYLHLRTVSSTEHHTITSFTHGHPLAISLVADMLEQRPGIPFTPDDASNVVHSLLERFIEGAPSVTHRAALEACALVRFMTEGLLADMLELTDAHDLFNWLRGLSFIDVGRQGLFPHDLVRDSLVADLRWRNPDRYAEFHQRARIYYTDRLRQMQGGQQRRLLLDLVYLHRDSLILRAHFESFFEGQDDPNLWIDRAQPADFPHLGAMVRCHEGEAAATLADYWFERQPQAALVVRNSKQEILGFMLMLALHDLSPADVARDPATRAAWEYLERRGALRSGELVSYIRFWMASDSYQDISPVQSRIFLHGLQFNLTTPCLAHTFYYCADPEMWAFMFAYGELLPIAELDFTVGEKRYGVYGYDWRALPPNQWLELMAEREMAMTGGEPMTPTPRPSQQPLLVLSRPEFADAVREALRHYNRATDLKTNPLLRSRLVLAMTNDESTQRQPIALLQGVLEEAIEGLQATPRQIKLYRALYHTYVKPAATQELAAELLDVPFSTYRRHLKSGIDSVVDYLWSRELDSSGINA